MTESSRVDPEALTALNLEGHQGQEKAPSRNPLSQGAMIYLPESVRDLDPGEQELILLRMLFGDMALHFRHNLLQTLHDIDDAGAYPPEMLAALRPSLFMEIDRFVELCGSQKLRSIALRFRQQFEIIYEAFESSEEPLSDREAFSKLSELIEILDPDEVFITGSVQPVGRGGFGVVYRGCLKYSGKEVAIKLIREKDQFSAMRAREEGLGLMQSQHIEGVLKAHTMFRARTDIAGIPNSAGHIVLITELINGPSFRMLLRMNEEGSFPVQQDMLRFLSDVCSTMSEVHDGGILHRDLKPSNVMIEEDGSIRVIDFGLIKRGNCDVFPTEAIMQSNIPIGSQSESFESFGHSKPGEAPPSFATKEKTRGGLGTAYYMSPEHLDSTCKQGSDVWSVMVMLIEVFHGEVIWDGFTKGQIVDALLRHRSGQTDILQVFEKKCAQEGKAFAESPLLKAIFAWGFNPAPERRPSMEEAAKAIRLYRVIRETDSEAQLEAMDEYILWRSRAIESGKVQQLKIELDDPSRQIEVHQTFIKSSLFVSQQALEQESLRALQDIARNVDSLLQLKRGKPPTLSDRHRRPLSIV